MPLLCHSYGTIYFPNIRQFFIFWKIVVGYVFLAGTIAYATFPPHIFWHSLAQGVGIRGEIIVPARRLELKHDATEVELTSTVRFL